MKWLFGMLCAAVVAAAEPPEIKPAVPFRVGETVKMRFKWAAIPVGYATFRVLPMTEYEGRPAWHFQAEIRTNAFADKIYKVRDRLDSYVAEDFSHSLHLAKRQREGGRARDVTVVYDWEAGTVQWHNGPDDFRAPIPVKPGTFDELGFFYMFRRYVLRPGLDASLPVTDGKKYYPGTIHVRQRTSLEIGERTYDTWLLEPDLSGLGGVFKGDRDAAVELWLSADEAAIPLKIRSELTIGHFSAEVMEIQRGADQAAEVISTEADDEAAAANAPADVWRALPQLFGAGR